jgi:hypothetical protein
MSVAYDYQANAKWVQWPAEMDADLTLMRNDGKSSSIIADILTKNHGRKVTRNAVIGRAKRLGLERLKVNAPTEHKNWGGVRGVPGPRRYVAPGAARTHHLHRLRQFRVVEASQPYVGSLNIPFMAIGGEQCRNIVSGDGEPVLCCGQPQTAASSYCGHHHAINHWVRP